MERTAAPVHTTGSALAAQAVVVSTGFFGLVAQTLVFREFLTVFEGNELGIAWFFATWLLWVAAGALGARIIGIASDRPAASFEFLPLLYIPAYLLQIGLMGNARALAGVEGFELFPLARMLPVSFLANAPVSICTGLLFPLACRWIAEHHRMPVARVYVLESFGGAVGGIGVTILLSHGAQPETAFLAAALPVSMATFLFRCSIPLSPGPQRSGPLPVLRRLARWSLLPPLALFLLLTTDCGSRWSRLNARRAWGRIMPARHFLGSFTTPQARYLYGYANGQFNVVAWQSIADTIPGVEHASEVLAAHLVQCPTARRSLIVGPGSFPLCSRLLSLRQTESVTWLDTDPQYPPRLLAVLPGELTVDTDRLNMPGADVRRHLLDTHVPYDLVIVNLPDVTTLTLNRYCTVEFFTLLGSRLSPGGVLGVRSPGAENFMGNTLANTGAAIRHTLQTVFRHTALRAGDETWLMASQSNRLSTAPAELRDRFAGIDGAEQLYPVDAVMSLYVPDRIDYQTAAYGKALAELGPDMLLNTDAAPKTLLYSLLFAASRAGAGAVAVAVTAFARSGALVFPAAILIYLSTRLLFRFDRRTGKQRYADTFDHHALVASAGALGMGTNLALLFMYQSAFGTVFLHIGLICALFMFGLSAGGFAMERLLSARPRLWRIVLAACCACHLLFIILICICMLPAGGDRTLFCLAFTAAGALSGAYVPIAATRLRDLGFGHLPSGVAVEISDHLGGAFGGLVVGLLLIPSFGSAAALCTIALLLPVNLMPLLPAPGAGPNADLFSRITRPAGYAMSGVAVFLVAASLLLTRGRDSNTVSAFLESIRAMCGELELTEPAPAEKDTPPLRCLVADTGGEPRYFVCSDRSAPDIRGYGGPVTVAAMLDRNGTILDLRLLPSAETPAYVDGLAVWLGQLRGRCIAKLGDVDVATGATLTSRAVRAALMRTGRAFSIGIMGTEDPGVVATQSRPRLPYNLVIIVFAGTALTLRRRPRIRVRQLFLAATVFTLGILLNLQYSLSNVLSLLAFRIPRPGASAAFILVIGVPVLVILFGNLYCGYLCPFGAAQELIGDLRPPGPGTGPDRTVRRYARTVKYVVLFLCIACFAPSLNHAIGSSDPLLAAFSRTAAGPVGLTFLLLALSFVFKRFWCRNLCPAGAFLSILGRVRLIRRAVPAVAVKLCDLGVRDGRDTDCICCDRCRSGIPEMTEQAAPRPVFHTIFLVVVAAVGIFFLRETLRTCTAHGSAARPARATQSGGEPRDADMRRLRGMIESGRLSDREAMHYRPDQ